MRTWICEHKLISLFLFALVLRLLVYFPLNYVVYAGELEHPDSLVYHEFATWVSEVRWKEVSVFEWTRLILVDWKTRGFPYIPYPEYGYGTALVYNIFGVNRFGPELLNMVISSLTAVLGFITIMKMFGSFRASIVAGVLLAIDPYGLYLSTQLLKDTSVIFAVALILVTLVDRRLWRYSGLAFLLLGLLRVKFALALGPLVMLYMLFKYRKGSWPVLTSLLVGALIVVSLNSESLLKENPLDSRTDVHTEAEMERASDMLVYLSHGIPENVGPNQDPITGRLLLFEGEIQPPVTHREFFEPRAAYLLSSILTLQVPWITYPRSVVDYFTFPQPWWADTLIEYGFAGYMAYWYLLLFVLLVALSRRQGLLTSIWPLLVLGSSMGLLLAFTVPGASSFVRWRVPTYYPVILSIAAASIYLPSAKRSLDIAFAAVAGLLLLPVIVPIGMTLLMTEGKILFRQKRVGKSGESFTIYKFVTMKPRSDGVPVTGNRDPRLTSFGRFLRRFALDEIPQIVNVIKGDMSIVGPRALAVWEHEDASNLVAGWYKRTSITPGMIGLAQVNGNRSDNNSKLYWDVEYIARQSLLFDFKIFLRGVVRCFKGRW
jgi:lipopolysaccharide/colanic/teichoic acid biosynthesis glycosyltransferase